MGAFGALVAGWCLISSIIMFIHFPYWGYYVTASIRLIAGILGAAAIVSEIPALAYATMGSLVLETVWGMAYTIILINSLNSVFLHVSIKYIIMTCGIFTIIHLFFIWQWNIVGRHLEQLKEEKNNQGAMRGAMHAI